MKQILFLILLLFSISAGAQTTTYYVKQGGSGNGTSWADASSNLQATVSSASSGNQVWVAAGTYIGGFAMKEGVNVLGGFPANANATTTKADRKLPGTGENLTILDGERMQRVLTQRTPFATETLWEGFVLRNGNANGVGTIVYAADNTTPVGVVCQYDVKTKSGKMIALEESATKLTWGPTNTITAATNLADGAKNWTRIESFINNGKNWADYPAWNYIKDLRETTQLGGYTDWYMPATKELEEIYAMRHVLNAALTVAGTSATPLSTDETYWSGSEDNAEKAWYVYLSDGAVLATYKTVSLRARAVRAFNLLASFWGTDGGGAYLQANGIVRNSIVEQCSAVGIGGGVYLGANANAEGCLVQNCVAINTSGVYVSDGAKLISSHVVKNTIDQTPQYTGTLPQIGDYYHSDGTWGTDAADAIVGVVCYINPSNPYSGYILHPNEEINKKWDDANAWVEGLGASWECPPIDVLQTICNNRDDINIALNKAGATPLSTNYYWSGSELNSWNAWRLDFGEWHGMPTPKGNTLRVRAVRAF